MVDSHLLRFNKEQKYLLFDFETCHLNLIYEDNLPWELAFSIITKDNILIEKEYLINWSLVGKTLNVRPTAAMLTGFYLKEEKLKKQGAHPKDVLDDFEKYLYDPSIKSMAHNGLSFDIYIHNLFRRLLDRKTDYSYLPNLIDTHLISKAYKLGAPFPEKFEDLLSFQFQLSRHIVKGVKTSIKAMCEEFHIDYDPALAHGALYDITRMHLIFQQLLYKCNI